jgi:1-acyl-sn-glycerol-3-phosphate acyltransferase
MQLLKFITTPPATPKGVEKRKAPPTTGVHYETDWAHGPGSRMIRRAGVWAFFKPATWLFARPKVIGTDRLERVEGPVILAANHHSHADTGILLATLPVHIRKRLAIAAGADYFFPNRVAAAASALVIGAIPIERTKLSKLSISNSIGVLESGRSLLIFPEGGRSPDGWSRKHRPGAAFLANQTGAPVVPVYLDGTGTVLPKGKFFPRRAPSAVVFGAPMTMGPDDDTRGFASKIEDRIAELADEFSSGWWEARRNAYQRNAPDLSGPDAGAWRRRWALGPKPGRRNPSKRPWPKP